MTVGRISQRLSIVMLRSDVTGAPLFFLVDSGSSISILSVKFLLAGVAYRPFSLPVATMSGKNVNILGGLTCTLFKGQATLGKQAFLISDAEMPHFDGILGSDWLHANNAHIDYQNKCVSLSSFSLPFVGKMQYGSEGLHFISPPAQEDLEVVNTNETEHEDDIRLYAAETKVIPGEHWGLLRVSRRGRSCASNNHEILVVDRGLVQPLIIGSAVVNFDAKDVFVPYVNVERCEVVIKRGQTVTLGTDFHESAENSSTGENEDPRVTEVLQGDACFASVKTKEKSAEGATESQFKALITEAVRKGECPDDLQPELMKLLYKYQSTLAQKHDKVGLTNLYQPDIPLDTSDPIYTPQYPVPHRMREEMKKSVNEFLDEGIIQYSTSPYNSPTIMVPKKDGGYRLVVDFRKLNQHVVTDPHPLPRINQILEELGEAKFFTALDLLSGFYNLEIRPEDRKKTAFSTIDGHYEFLRLPMGLKNSPSVFQRLMNVVLSGTLGKYAYIYIDDIIVYSKSADEHLNHLGTILDRVARAGLKIKLSKSQIFRTAIDYLGFIVSREGLKVNPAKVRAIQEFPTPKDVKGVQAFLGVVGYFRTFVKNFAEKARPLYQLLKQDVDFVWNAETQKAMDLLKHDMVTAPVLAFPDFSKPFLLTCDASGYAVGAVLTQMHGKKEKLISCASRTLKDAETRYHNTDREVLAAVYGVKKHRSYLWGNRFTIVTDHQAIPFLAKNKTDNPRAIRWYLDLCEYDYTVMHKPGTSIKHADALSRYPSGEDEVDHSPEVDLVAYLSPGLQAPDLIPMISVEDWKIAQQQSRQLPSGANYVTEQGLVFRLKDDVKLMWVPPNFRNHVLKLFHDPPSIGHSGMDRMAKAMKSEVYWTNMDADIQKYVRTCDLCQRFKCKKDRNPMRATPVPFDIFEDISLDVVGPVPISRNGYRYILVVQDRLSRWISFSPMSDTSAITTARTFLADWVCSYGVPKKLITDQGRNFVSQTFRDLSEFLGIKQSKTTAYRPTSNGQNERTHRELHQFISMYMNDSNRHTWDTVLKNAAWIHNSSFHEALQCSPFEVVTGVKPRSAKVWLPSENDAETIKEMIERCQKFYGVDLKRLEELRRRVRAAIVEGQAKYLDRANKLKVSEKFNVGDLVLIKTHYLKTYEGRKWTEKFEGPFKIAQVLTSGTVKVTHVNKTGWEDIIHIAYIKKYNPRSHSPPPESFGKNSSLRGVDDEDPWIDFDVEQEPLAGKTPVGPTELISERRSPTPSQVMLPARQRPAKNQTSLPNPSLGGSDPVSDSSSSGRSAHNESDVPQVRRKRVAQRPRPTVRFRSVASDHSYSDDSDDSSSDDSDDNGKNDQTSSPGFFRRMGSILLGTPSSRPSQNSRSTRPFGLRQIPRVNYKEPSLSP